jgi:hypothetical protein
MGANFESGLRTQHPFRCPRCGEVGQKAIAYRGGRFYHLCPAVRCRHVWPAPTGKEVGNVNKHD